MIHNVKPMIFNKKLKSLKYRNFRTPVRRIGRTRLAKVLTKEMKKTPEAEFTPELPELKPEGD